MQLNPSTDFYDDQDEYEDDGFYDEDKDDESNVDDDEEPESLPEPKELVKPADEEEEEDMGYDEDDERIAIAVERPKEMSRSQQQEDNKEFMNEEGSGSFGRTALNRYKSNDNEDRFRLDYLEKYRKKQQKLLTESAKSGDEVDLRESSGNFANDDEDDDDDDATDEDESNDGFFNSKRNSNSRYFRKNTNDAIKIISTPLGKVGIVYQQTPNQSDDKKKDGAEKKATSFTDFDALSPDPESSHRLASSHPKITPVLTPDGKVALLYRGDSENSKYEPIRNLTHKFQNKNDATDNKATATNTKDTKLDKTRDNSDDDRSDNDSTNSDDNDEDDTGPNSNTNSEQTDESDDNTNAKLNTDDIEPGSALFPALAGPTKSSFIIRPTDSVLPMINRPLSEVLGIKKNQFKQFRIKDMPTTTTTTDATPRSLAAGGVAFGSDHSDTTTLHFLTKVNLADYPTSARSRNHDFDFSRDNTMLDERTRHKQQQEASQNEELDDGSNKANTIANDEVLAKTEVVNLAIIPHFDEELERLQRLREHETRRHHRQRHNRHKQTEEDLSGIHCIMQAMMGIAAISTVFGMLGTFFKQRILDQIRLMHW